MNSRPRCEFILDASALLAALLGEPGEAMVREVIDRAYIHAVNLAEVVAELARSGVPREEIELSLAELHLPVEQELPREQAIASAWAPGGLSGLPLGGRICLGAAEASGSIALTTDPAWLEIAGGERVRLIR